MNSQIITKDSFEDCLEKLKSAKVISFDLETSGLNPFNNDKIAGVGFYLPEIKEGFYLPFNHQPKMQMSLFEKNDSENLDMKLLDELKPVFDSPEKTFIGHNLKFDMKFLRKFGVEVNGILRDTMILSWLEDENRDSFALKMIGKEYESDAAELLDEVKNEIKTQKLENYSFVGIELLGKYCIKDCYLSNLIYEGIYKKLIEQDMEEAIDQEMKLIKVLMNMEYSGLLIDKPKLLKQMIEVDERLMNLEQDMKDISGMGDINFRSPIQIKKIVFDNLGLEPLAHTPKGAPKVDDEFLMNNFEEPFCQKLYEYRGTYKIKTSYLLPFLSLMDSENRLHCNFWQHGTVTGRLSCHEPNMQALPNRFSSSREKHHLELSKQRTYEIRDLFVAPENSSLVFMDYEQMELRVFAIYADEQNMLDTFIRGDDVHAENAKSIFGELPSKEENEQEYKRLRQWAKSISFGIIYGMGTKSLAKFMQLDFDETELFYSKYMDTFPNIQKFMHNVDSMIRKRGYSRTWKKRRRRFTNVGESYKAVNAIIQGSCADIVKQAMIRCNDLIEGKQTKMILQIHDELVFEVPDSEKDLIPKLADLCTDFPEFKDILKIETRVSKQWSGEK